MSVPPPSPPRYLGLTALASTVLLKNTPRRPHHLPRCRRQWHRALDLLGRHACPASGLRSNMSFSMRRLCARDGRSAGGARWERKQRQPPAPPLRRYPARFHPPPEVALDLRRAGQWGDREHWIGSQAGRLGISCAILLGAVQIRHQLSSVGSSLERSAALLWRQSDLVGVIQISTCLYVIGLVPITVHLRVLLAWRIKVITESYIIPAFVSLLALASGSSGIAMFVTVLQTPKFRDFDKFKRAVCDILIAGGMTYALLTRKTGFSVIDGHINQIVRLTIETGSLTAIFALANVMLFLVFPGVLPFSKVIGRLPVASNSREPKRAKDAEQGRTENSPQTLSTNQNTYRHHQKIQPSMIYHTSNEKEGTGDVPADAARDAVSVPEINRVGLGLLMSRMKAPSRGIIAACACARVLGVIGARFFLVTQRSTGAVG
ncbi:hypothetical protein B0H14DRAFT_3160825 [Mycena olivaceomarginata]|nr:hypothetical protein B0H14DRAFT_3160825 [Mycena olivaceomarginata]